MRPRMLDARVVYLQRDDHLQQQGTQALRNALSQRVLKPCRYLSLLFSRRGFPGWSHWPGIVRCTTRTPHLRNSFAQVVRPTCVHVTVLAPLCGGKVAPCPTSRVPKTARKTDGPPRRRSRRIPAFLNGTYGTPMARRLQSKWQRGGSVPPPTGARWNTCDRVG